MVYRSLVPILILPLLVALLRLLEHLSNIVFFDTKRAKLLLEIFKLHIVLIVFLNESFCHAIVIVIISTDRYFLGCLQVELCLLLLCDMPYTLLIFIRLEKVLKIFVGADDLRLGHWLKRSGSIMLDYFVIFISHR